MKRVVLFILTNLLVLVTISVVLSLLGVGPYIEAQGINYQNLMVFCAIWGMAGSFISLGLSKFMAKRLMGVQIIDSQRASQAELLILQTVHNQARAAGLSKMPEVGIYDSPEVNAFATGPSKNNALVAVSAGLLHSMNRDELEGVLAHEVSHIANGDMVTMTLIQGIINAFVMFFARIAAFGISQVMRDNEDGPSPLIHFGLVILFDILFGILGSFVVAAFSRQREFRADAGAAKIAGKHKMIAALENLKNHSEMVDNRERAVASLKISGGKSGGFWALMATHPTLEKRIEALRSHSY